MTTELRLNAPVVCADGPAGRLADVILDPRTDQVTHLVVEVKGFGHPQHLVPVALLQATDGREVRLRCLREELAQTEFFTETEQVPMDGSTAWAIADDTLPFPVTSPRFGTLLIEHERVPPGELAVHRDTPVEASDGPVGRLAAFVLQSDDDRVANVVVRRGYWWWRQEMEIPTAAIERIDTDAVHLNLSRARVRAFPTLPPGSAA
jgi:uncharacterized protein YrrD